MTAAAQVATAVVVEAAAAPAPQALPVAAPAPIQVQAAAPTPPIVTQAQAIRVDQATLHAIVQTAGLQWVETDPVRVAQAMASQRVVPVKLGREPKPSAAVSSEPLVQVETIR